MSVSGSESNRLLAFPRKNGTTFHDTKASSIRHSDTKAAIFNLLTSVIGGGTLTIPFVMQSAGLGLGIVLFIVVGIVNAYAIEMLFSCGRAVIKSSFLEGKTFVQDSVGEDNKIITYARAGFLSLGPYGQRIAAGAVFLYSYMAIVAFWIALSDIIPQIVGFFITGTFFTTRIFAMLCIFTVAFPITFIRKVTELWFLSAIAISCVYVLIFAIIYRGIELFMSGNAPQGGPIVWVNLDWSIFTAIAIISVSYVCQVLVFPIFSELKDQEKTVKLGVISMSTAGVTYLTVGIFGYLQFRGDTDGNIFLNYPDDDGVMLAGRIALTIKLTMSLVLVTYSARRSFISFFWDPNTFSNTKEYIVNCALIFSTFGLANIFEQLEQIWALAGSTVGVLLAFILPALFWLRIHCKPDDYWKETKAKICSVQFVVGIILAIIATAISIRNFVEDPPNF